MTIGEQERQGAPEPPPASPAVLSPPERIWREDEGRPFEPAPSSASERERGRPEGRRRHRRSRRTGVRSYAAPTLAFLAVLIAGDALFVAVRLAGGLAQAREQLKEGAAALEHGDLQASMDAMAVGLQGARQAAAAARRPSLVMASFLPFIGGDARAVRALADAGVEAGRAAVAAVEAARTLGIRGDGLAPSIYEDGKVRLGVLQRAGPQLERAQRLMAEAQTILGSVLIPRLGIVDAALRDARANVGDAADALHDATALVSALPQLLGKDGGQRYLLVFQATGEARGTGGVIGAYGVLEADAGRIRLVRVGPPRELFANPLAPVDAPRWFRRNYGPFSLQEFSQANLSPNFPVVAQVLLNMYEQATGVRLDGVVAMDPIAFQELMRGARPIVAKAGLELGADNAATVIMRDSYVELGRKEQEEFVADVVKQYWGQVRAGDIDPPATADGLGRAARGQHLKVYVRDAKSQAAITELGANGSYSSAGPNVQMVFNNNYSVNKVDFFLRRSIDTTVTLTDEGDAHVVTTATVENGAPAGPGSVLLGFREHGRRPGLNQMVLSFLLPQGAVADRVLTDGSEQTILFFNEAAYPVIWRVVELGPGETSEVTVSYRIPAATSLSASGPQFTFTLFPHASATPDDFSLTIVAPPGFKLVGPSDRPDAAVGKLTLSGSLTESMTVTLTLVAA